jgi:hypothetical protein
MNIKDARKTPGEHKAKMPTSPPFGDFEQSTTI